MAGEDYIVERDGIQMNISKAIKYDKIKRNTIKFYHLNHKFKFDNIVNVNNIIKFQLYGNTYYYGLASNKIRREGEWVWSTKIISILKSDIKKMYDARDDYH